MIKEHLHYLKNNPQNYWFKAKLYGWGWYPATWQGWLVLAIYITIVFLATLTIDNRAPVDKAVLTFILPVILLTAVLIYICYKTGEKPRWQWGPPDEDTTHNKKH
jgi:uncharacterized membrane protein YhaH (DUF805 family)